MLCLKLILQHCVLRRTYLAAGLLDDMLDIHGEQPAGSAELCATFA